jgi:hypothetical protein
VSRKHERPRFLPAGADETATAGSVPPSGTTGGPIDILAVGRAFLSELQDPSTWRTALPEWCRAQGLPSGAEDALRVACVRLRAFHADELGASNAQRRRRR